MDEYGESPYAERIKTPVSVPPNTGLLDLIDKEGLLDWLANSEKAIGEALEANRQSWRDAFDINNPCPGCPECGQEAPGIGDS